METSVSQISLYIVSWYYFASFSKKKKKKKKIRGTCSCHKFKGMILESEQEKTQINFPISLNF